MGQLAELRNRLFEGMVIPAHPLALTGERNLDERYQRALTRYYLASGAGGIAVGVHTTQFPIHRPEVGLYLPVLELAREESLRFEASTNSSVIKVAGIVGPTGQAVDEASIARSLGYDCGLLSLGALKNASDHVLVEHARAVSEVIPLFGFYLQPAVGGRLLGYRFWRSFVEIDNVVAIKIAPFNRYCTNDVIRAVVDSGRASEIALYTGNDDNIIADLITPFSFEASDETSPVRFSGGLLGQWAVWTQRSVEILEKTQRFWAGDTSKAQELLRLNVHLTDANAAIFDAANDFRGCIPGIHEILRRQGLMQGNWCLDPEETLSAGQAAEIDRVCSLYPHLSDDEFVSEHRDDWLSG